MEEVAVEGDGAENLGSGGGAMVQANLRSSFIQLVILMATWVIGGALIFGAAYLEGCTGTAYLQHGHGFCRFYPSGLSCNKRLGLMLALGGTDKRNCGLAYMRIIDWYHSAEAWDGTCKSDARNTEAVA